MTKGIWFLFLKRHWFTNLNVVNVIDKGILSTNMILALGAGGPEFNSQNVPSNLSWQKVFEFSTENKASLGI